MLCDSWLYITGSDKPVMSDWLKDDDDCPLFLPSPVYSRLDKPVEYAYKDKVSARKRREPDSDEPESAITLG